MQHKLTNTEVKCLENLIEWYGVASIQTNLHYNMQNIMHYDVTL